MTWASFSCLFMEKYIPQTLRFRKRDKFLILEQGRMSVNAYEAKFHALSRYATQLCFSPQERIRRFVKGLRSELRISALQDPGSNNREDMQSQTRRLPVMTVSDASASDLPGKA